MTYYFPEEFPSWAPVFFTFAGLTAVIVGILDCIFDFKCWFLHNDGPGLIFFGAISTVVGIIWWRKQNAPPY